MENGIRIGGTDKHSLAPLTESIVRIMSAPADQKTIRAALQLLGRVADTSNLTISDVNIIGEKHDHYHDAPSPSDEQNDG